MYMYPSTCIYMIQIFIDSITLLLMSASLSLITLPHQTLHAHMWLYTTRTHTHTHTHTHRAVLTERSFVSGHPCLRVYARPSTSRSTQQQGQWWPSYAGGPSSTMMPSRESVHTVSVTTVAAVTPWTMLG